MRKRLLSMLIAVCMVFTILPSAAFAEDSGLPVGTNNVADSGEPVCICTEKCTPADTKSNISGNINPDCPVCGAEGADLTLCSGETVGTNNADSGEPVCTCTEKCTPADTENNISGNINPDCPVCGAEGADLTLCSGEPVGTNNADSGEPVCTCTEKCTPADTESNIAGSIKSDCPVCGAKGADLTMCNGMSADLPAAQALDYAVPLNITPRTTTLDLTTDSYKTEEGVVEENGVYTKSAEGWSYDTSEKTLTLSGVSIIGEDSDGGSYGLRLTGDATIKLSGETTNTVSGGRADGDTYPNNSSRGITCDGTLTIEGTGTLTTAGGAASNGYSYGIYAGKLTINSGTITATAGNAAWSSWGIAASANGAINMKGGRITAKGGDAAQTNSHGIYTVNGTILISGGSGSATSGTAPTTSAFSKALETGSLALTGNWNDKTASWDASDEPTSGEIWDGTSAQYFDGGSGTEADPYQIRTAEQLALLSDVIAAGFPKTVIAGGAEVNYPTLQTAHYKLTADINLNDTADWESWSTTAPANSWKQIGTEAKNFKGTFDGNSKTVSGIYFSDTGERYSGLFGCLNSGTIQNLTVAKSYIKGDWWVGGVVGCNDGGTIKTCQNAGNISGTGFYVGGLVGLNTNSSTVDGCNNSGSVAVDNTDNPDAAGTGGVVGWNQEASTVTNCHNSGTVSGNKMVGGVVGKNGNGDDTTCTVENCQNSGTVSGIGSNVGGVVGYNLYSTVKNCTSPKGLTKDATGDIGENDKPTETHEYIGNVIGFGPVGTGNSSDPISNGITLTPVSATVAKGGTQQFTAKIDDTDTTAITWSIVGGDGKATIDENGLVTIASNAADGTYYLVKAVSTADETKFGMAMVKIGTVTPSGKVWDGTCALYFNGGRGTEADPYQIATAEQLYLLSAVIGRFDFSDRRNYKDYVGYARKVVADQEAQTNEYLSKAYYKLNADIILNDSSTFNNWIPIGRNYANDYNNMSLFSGSFDGCNHTIDGIRFGDGYTVILSVGLFSSNTSESTIKNVTIGSGYIHGNRTSGGLVGENRGTMENCINKAAISSQVAIAGGLVGANSGTVKNCQNTGDITANACAGGIVGSNIGKVESCQNIGKLNGRDSTIGGVVGINTNNHEFFPNYQEGTVTNCTSPKGLVPNATGDTGTYWNPSRFVYYRGHIIGNGDDGSSSDNSSGNVANGLSISPSSWICPTTGSQLFTATVDNGTGDQSVTWSIINGDSSISVDKSGKVTVTSCDWDGKNYIIMATSTTDSRKYATASVTISIPTPAAPKITTTSLPNGMVGTAYSQTLAATGYPSPTWSVTAGSLPTGLTLGTDGKISGTPKASGTSTFTVTATNDSGSDTKELSIIVESPITSVSVTPATATVKKTKTQQFTAVVEGTATDKTVTWGVNSTNSSIDKNGLLTVGGRETAATLTVKATSTLDSSKFATATVTVAAAPKVCTVTFDSDGGSAISAISGIEEGSIIKLPNNPAKTDHRFDGWYTQKNGGGTQFTSATAVTNSITVYAKWTKLVTVSGIVVEEEGETPISGASVTLSPAYGTTTRTTNADGKFSFANIPEDYFTVTATFDDNSTVTVNVIGDYGNVKIIKPKPYLTITTQPKDSYIIKGIAGQSAVFNVLGKRTPHIADSVAYEWWWLNGNTPAGASPDVKMTGSGSQMTINQDNGNIPDRGNYRLYALAYTNDTVPLEAYSRVANLKVVGVNTIEGMVKKDNSPVENAKVELVYAGGAWPYGSVAKTSSTNPQTTIADGKYKFELVPDGKYKLIITLPNGGGTIIDGPHDFPKTDPDAPIEIIVPDKASIQISGQPQDATVKSDTAVNLTVDAVSTDSTALTYQWYKNTKNSNNGGNAISGATAKTYTPTTADKGTNYYYCMVSGGSLEAVNTRAAKVTVFTYGTIAGTVQTKDKQPIKGAKVELINIDSPVQTGFTTSTNPQTTLTDGKYKFIEVPDGKYKLKVTLPGGEMFEVQPINVPNVTPDIPVTPPDKPTIRITSQPKDMTVSLNDTAEFTVGAGVSTGGKVMYQWFQNATNSITGGKAIDGATAAAYRAQTNAKSIIYYYCVVQATGADAVTSNIAKLTVRNTPVNNLITIEGDVVDESNVKVEGAEVTLSPKAGTSQNPQTTKADGHYKFDNLPDGKYTITVKLPGGGEIIKEVVIDDGKITPTPPNNIVVPATNSITITQQPKSIEVTTDMTASFTAKATATKAHVTYQWYKSTSNVSSGGTKLEDKTEATLKLDKQTEGESYYYCVVSSIGATDIVTDAAKLTVTKASGDNGSLNGGVIDDEDGHPVKDATVKLMKNGTNGIQFGSTVTTGEDGKFEFTSIPYGSYSLVAQKDNSTVTRQITIKSASATENLTMPSGAKITKVVIEGSSTPSAAAENLEAMFTEDDNTTAQQPGATVEIKLVVKKQDSPADKDDIDTALTENQRVGIYLDAKLVKTIDGSIANNGTQNIQPQAGQMLRIVLDLPTALQGKTGYQIIRSHTENGVTDVRVITPSYDSDLQTLSFNADAFSTYAVVYTQTQKYSVTVIGSQAGAGSGTGLYKEGAIVTIQAGSKSGSTFTGWTNNDGVSFANSSSSTTTFTMPVKNVTVTANWKFNGSSGKNDDDDNDDDENDDSSNSDNGSRSDNVSSSGSSSKPGSSSSSSSSSKPGSSNGNNTGGGSDSGSNGDSNSSSAADKKNNSDDLNKPKDDALQNLADGRQKSIDSLPNSLTDEQRQAAMDEIDRVYTQAVKDIKNADSTQDISDIADRAFINIADVVAGAGCEMPTQAVAENQKTFVLLSAILAATSVFGTALAWRRREDEETYGDNPKHRRIIAVALAATAILLFLLTTGWHGITFANWWTIAVAIPTVGSLLFTLRNINK